MKVDWDEYALNPDPMRFKNLRAVWTEPIRIECSFNAHWNASADTPLLSQLEVHHRVRTIDWLGANS